MGRNNKDSNQINGLIDKGCSIEGKLAFDGTVQVNGDFNGDILSDGTLIIGPEARISARIRIDTVIIEGNVEGTIEAKQRVEMRRGATMTGDIHSPSLVVEEGAVFQGMSNMMRSGAEQGAEKRTFAAEESYAAEEGADSLMM